MRRPPFSFPSHAMNDKTYEPTPARNVAFLGLGVIVAHQVQPGVYHE